jgi:hypothetical protein
VDGHRLVWHEALTFIRLKSWQRVHWPLLPPNNIQLNGGDVVLAGSIC